MGENKIFTKDNKRHRNGNNRYKICSKASDVADKGTPILLCKETIKNAWTETDFQNYTVTMLGHR